MEAADELLLRLSALRLRVLRRSVQQLAEVKVAYEPVLRLSELRLNILRLSFLGPVYLD